jgi:hypothetical protein
MRSRRNARNPGLQNSLLRDALDGERSECRVLVADLPARESGYVHHLSPLITAPPPHMCQLTVVSKAGYSERVRWGLVARVARGGNRGLPDG